MRKLILAILVALVISTSCTPYWINLKGYVVHSDPLESSWKFVAVPNHRYFSTRDWQSPREFEAAGGGMCVGFAIDLMYYLGEDAEFVICKTSFCNPGDMHAIVKYHGQYLEAQQYGVTYTLGDGYLISIDDTYSYYSIMQSVTNFGTRGINSEGDLDAYNKIMSYTFTDNPVPVK
jgi:hypothetical protein